MTEKHTSPGVLATWVVGILGILAATFIAIYSKYQSPADLKILPPLPPAAQNPNSIPHDEVAFQPNGPETSTIVYVENDGDRGGLLQSVQLHSGNWIKTPVRQKQFGALITIPAIFREENFDPKSQRFQLVLNPPSQIANDDFANVMMTIVIPKYYGYTYRGRATLTFNGNHSIDVNGIVDVDVQTRVPHDINEAMKK